MGMTPTVYPQSAFSVVSTIMILRRVSRYDMREQNSFYGIERFCFLLAFILLSAVGLVYIFDP